MVSRKLLGLLPWLLALSAVFLTGAIHARPLLVETKRKLLPSQTVPDLSRSVEVSGPYFDESRETLILEVGMKAGVEAVPDAQDAITHALERLAAAENGLHRKVLKIQPGHYIFSRPIVFRQHYLGIDLVGEPALTRSLTGKSVEPSTIREEIAHIRGRLPVIDGDGVTSFLVADGVAAPAHLSIRISGFYFVQQMSGLGGSYYPDFSYRLGDEKFVQSGGYYTRYAFNDGGVVSVLGNSSVVFEHNLVDQATAYTCGGVIRNEQYGAPGNTTPSVVAFNIILNPFAWHTGSFVDNNTGSYIKVLGNQVVLDRQIPHEIDLVTNFDDAFLIAENNRFIDARADQSVSIIGLRLLGQQGGIFLDRNRYDGIGKPYERIPTSPPFPENRSYYFLVRQAKILKLAKSMTSWGSLEIVRPGEWPDDIAPLVRTKDLQDGDPLRIAALRMHFSRLTADPRNQGG